MKIFNIYVLFLAISLPLGICARAESMSKNQFESLKKRIDAQYKVAEKKCDPYSGNTKDICEAEAKSMRNTAKTELSYNYNPTGKALYKARITKADGDYSVAIQKCDDKGGNVENVCEKEAKAAKIQQTAAAEAQMKTTKADDVAIEKSTDARHDAEVEMRNANYAVAKQKCEALAGDAEDLCIKDAKIYFGK